MGRASTGNYAIVGLGVVAGPQVGRSPRMVQAEACWKAIEDAGLRREDIDGAVDTRFSGGATDPPSWLDPFPRVMGLPINFYYSVGRGGAMAGLGIATALSFLDRGMASYVLIAGIFDQYSRSQRTRQEQAGGAARAEHEGLWGRPLGYTAAVTFHVWLASRHMYEFGTTSEQLGMIAVQQRAWAQLNPEAKMHGRTMTLEDHQRSPWVVKPYRLLDLCLVSDGAIAVVLTSGERARDCRKPPVWLLGQGMAEAAAELWWNKQNYTRLPVAKAKEQAFRQAGLRGVEEVDVAQLYDCFTGEVLLQLEDYGWCGKGEGGPFVAEGRIGPGGDCPVNTSGGLLSAYDNADWTGLAECVRQLREEAGERQVRNARVALFTGHGGELVKPGMCSIHTTTLLGRD